MFSKSFSVRRLNVLFALLVLVGGLALSATPARAQDAMTKESAAVVKAAFLADIEVMRGKFLGLAQAFPPDKYTWRPMEGVRSVSEVLMLIASEGYGFAPTALGGKAALGREEMAPLSKVTDKAQVIDHLNKSFAYAKQTLDGIDPATLTAKRRVMGQDLALPNIILAVGGDMHEHLGQLIAYARMNHIVPPWSK
jgi:DinB superfamily